MGDESKAVERLTADGLALGHALTHVEIGQLGVNRHGALHHVVKVERLARGQAGVVVEEVGFAT